MDDYTQHHYEELLKLLVILSSDSATQLEAYGLGNAEDEMATDLETYFTLVKDNLLSKGFIQEDVAKDVEDLDEFFAERSGTNDTGFWTELETHSEWQTVRETAKNILAKMNKAHLAIKIETGYLDPATTRGVVVQRIQIHLIDN